MRVAPQWANRGALSEHRSLSDVRRLTMALRPYDLDNLVMWLRADELNLDADDLIRVWPDEGPNHRHAVHVSANLPNYKTNEVNSLPAGDWGGSDDHLTVYNMADTDVAGGSGDEVTIFMVAREDTDGNNDAVLSWGPNTTSNVIKVLFWGDGNIYWDVGDETNGRVSVSKPSGFTGSYHLCEFYRSGADSEIVVDGTVEASGSSLTASISSSDSVIRLGDRPSEDRPLNGKIAELVWVAGGLSSGTRAAVRTYLNDKYALY